MTAAVDEVVAQLTPRLSHLPDHTPEEITTMARDLAPGYAERQEYTLAERVLDLQFSIAERKERIVAHMRKHPIIYGSLFAAKTAFEVYGMYSSFR